MAQKNNNKGSSNRGFAAMDKNKQREIAAKGGRASHSGTGRSDSGSQSNSRSDR